MRKYDLSDQKRKISMAARNMNAPLSGEKAEALQQMDLEKIARAYVATAINTPGYKALLLDRETMKTCSTLFGRTELAESNVVHIERLDGQVDQQKQHKSLKGIVLIRPTRDNITLLKRELKAPRFQEVHVYFTNLLSPMHLHELAEADAPKESITEIQEVYNDFNALDKVHFCIPCPRNELFLMPKNAASAMSSAYEYELVDRCVQGLSALFLAVRRKPLIRYQRGSDHAQRVADNLYGLTYKQQNQMFDFGNRSQPVVLILDRKDDPVTPLLMQWTYQAMIHELVGLDDNTVKLSGKAGEEPKEMVLDPRLDDFYRKHLHVSYGEVMMSVKSLMEQYQATESKHKKVESLDDMRRFFMEHPEFTRLQGNVIKHYEIVSNLSETVNRREMLDVSSMEQELANPSTSMTSASSFEDVMRLLRMISVSDKDKIRLVMLYALRFEEDRMRVGQLQDYLVTAGVKDREPKAFSAIDAVLRVAGQSQRAGDLYATRSLVNKALTMFKGLQGVENVYTQHTPLITATLTNISQDKLEPSAYPYMAASADEAMAYQNMFKRTPPKEVILFIVGGSTYEEAKAVQEWNERNPHMRVIIGGTAVLNSTSYIHGLTGEGLVADGPRKHTSFDYR